jgi:hypothetical protein
VEKSVAETKRNKIRLWLIALAALTFLASFAIPWTAEVGWWRTTLRGVLILMGIWLIIAAFPGYEFLLKSRRFATNPEDLEDE